MGCPPDHRVPSLHPGHPISTMMPLAYFWVSQMLLLQSAVSLSGGDTDNKISDLFSPWTTSISMSTMILAPTIAANCVAFVALYQICTDLNNIFIPQRWDQRARLLLQRDAKMSHYVNMVSRTPEGVIHTICNSRRRPSSTQLFESLPIES